MPNVSKHEGQIAHFRFPIDDGRQWPAPCHQASPNVSTMAAAIASAAVLPPHITYWKVG